MTRLAMFAGDSFQEATPIWSGSVSPPLLLPAEERVGCPTHLATLMLDPAIMSTDQLAEVRALTDVAESNHQPIAKETAGESFQSTPAAAEAIKEKLASTLPQAPARKRTKVKPRLSSFQNDPLPLGDKQDRSKALISEGISYYLLQ